MLNRGGFKVKTPNGFEVISLFEKMYPKHLAMEGDKIGLQIGTLNKKISHVLIALDVTMGVIEEAIEKGANLIIAHHPLIFSPLKHIQTESIYGKMLEACIKHDIAIYAAHTNVDIAEGGVNDMLAEALELEKSEILVETYEESLKKLVVFIPKSHEEKVRTAVGNAGAGFIGEYSHCTYRGEGMGTFMPQDGSNPFVGSHGKLEEVEEIRLETIFPASLQRAVIRAMLQAHPYEEVAYDIYPVENKGATFGLGRIGALTEEMTLQQFAEHVKEKLEVERVRIVGKGTDIVKKVAVLGGDGNKYFRSAKFAGADVYVTGDIYYHTAHDAMMEGLNMIDPGHNVEKVMKKGVQKRLQEALTENKLEAKVVASEVSTEPFVFV